METVRELTQLIFAFKQQIPKLDTAINKLQIATIDDHTLHRLIFMPTSSARKIGQFAENYQKAQTLLEKTQRETARNRAYSEFLNSESNDVEYERTAWHSFIIESKLILFNHLRHEYSETAEYLVLEADLHLARLSNTPDIKLSQIFQTDLFRPTQLPKDTIDSFPEGPQRLSGDELDGRAPYEWVNSNGLPFSDRSPYPLPEVGYATKTQNLKTLPEATQLLIDLMLHRSFYNENKQADIIFCGRIFEIVIASLVRDLEPHDLNNIIARPPYYSLHDIVGDEVNDAESDLVEASIDKEYDSITVALTKSINDWRTKEKISTNILSSWLTFNVLNRYFRQAWQFNKPNSVPAKENITHLINVARRAFRSLWNAFASVEKGEVFGMPNIIANVSIGDGEAFENSDLYRQNISPFLHSSGNKSFGAATHSYTAALSSHPIKQFIEDIYQTFISSPEYKAEHSEKPFYESDGRLITNIIKKYFEIQGRIEQKIPTLKATGHDITRIVTNAEKANISRLSVLENKHIKEIMKINGIKVQ